MNERWDTLEAINAARERFEATIPGWSAPSAYGIGRVVDGHAQFVRINTAAHRLPAVILAVVCGHTSGSSSYVLKAADLDRAIELLAPAEAYTGQDHPNIAAWRHLRATLTTAADTVVAVFDGDPASPCDDEYVVAMREEIRRSR